MPGMASQSETKSYISYRYYISKSYISYGYRKEHIIHTGAHEHHPISSSLKHIPLLS